jgi:hypothetical protein
MAIAQKQSAAPKSGSEEISELADTWAMMAVQIVLDPDEGAVLQTLTFLIRALATDPRRTTEMRHRL